MKKIILLFLLTPILVYAQTNNLGSTTLSTYQIGSSAWYPIFKQASLWLFGALATIELVIVFGMKAIKGELEIGGIFAELIRLTLLFGLFINFYAHPEWIDSIFQGFSTLGNQANAAAGVSTVVSIDTLTDAAAELLSAINKEQSWWSPVDSVILGLIGLIEALTIIFLGIELLVAYVKFLLFLNLSVLFFAFGAFGHTRQWAYNAVTNIIKSGTEYMLIKLVIGLDIANIKTQAPLAMKSEGSLFALLITVLMIFGITRMIHSIADSFISGMGAANSGSLGGMAKGAMMGAGAGLAGGAAAGLSQVKAATAAGEMAGSPSIPNIPGSSGGGSSTENTGKSGNFMNSAKSAAKNVSAVGLGAIGGAASGAIKGAAGFSHHGAGSKTGSGVGKSINAASAAAKKIVGTDSPKEENNQSSEGSSSLASGTISKGSNDKSSYVSGVPSGSRSSNTK
jgi:P-type conjugative transfer protein TrbL